MKIEDKNNSKIAIAKNDEEKNEKISKLIEIQ